MQDKFTWEDLFDFSGPNPISKATKAILSLEDAYQKLASNLTAEAIRIGLAQNELMQSLNGLAASIRAVNLATEGGRKNAAGLSTEIDTQARAYNGLKAAQKGAEVTNKAVADSLAGLRKQLQADRAELVALGQSANPERINQLAASILDTKTKSEQLEKAVRGVNSVFAAAKGSYNAILNENRQLSLELKSLGGVFDKNVPKTQETINNEAELKEKLAANTQILKNYDAQLNQHFRNVGNYADSIIQAVKALNDEKAALNQQAVALTTAAKATNLDAAAQDKLQKELSETKAKLAEVNTKLEGYGVSGEKAQTVGQQLSGSLKNAGASLKDFAVNMAVTTFGLAAIAAGIKGVIGLNIDYSDKLADTAKTTGLTVEQTSELAEALKKVDTRTSIDELLKIAEIGGQLGIAKTDVEGFTKAIDVASIALKNDFGGDVERIATELGKINTIFKTSDGVGIEKALLDIGSAVNELGAAGAATAPFLTDYAQRVGAVAANAGLGLDKVLGFGAALEELGFSAEVAGSATNKLLAGLSGNPSGFFSIAKLAQTNLSLKEFKNLVNNDINKAFELFLQGLRKGGSATTDFAQLVQSLKLKSGGAVSVLTALARNTELVADRQRIANEQLDNGQSLANEAAIKNNNLAASYDKLKNALENQVTGSGGFASFLKSALDYTTQIIKGNIDWKESLLTLIPLYSQFKNGTIFGGPAIVVKGQQKSIEDYGLAIALSSKAMQDAAGSAEALYAKYTALANATNPTTAQQKELREVTLKLRDALGDSAVILDREKGQFVLNTAAVEKNIEAKRSEAYTNGQRLAQRVNQLNIELEKESALTKAMQERASLAKQNLESSGIKNPGSKEADKFVADSQRALNSPNQIYGTSTISQDVINSYGAYKNVLTDVENATRKASITEHDRDMVLNRLKIIFPNLTDLQALLATATKAETTATLDDVKAKKGQEKAAKDALAAIDGLAKAQYELARFRAENSANKFENQAGNEANSESFRLEAAKKASAQRIEVARLEEEEKVRLAVAAARDLQTREKQDLDKGTITQGEYAETTRKISATLALQRTLISEQYAARVKEVERDLTKEQREIHLQLIAQLAEIDNIRINMEQTNLQTIIDNEDAGYTERKAALEQFNANRVLLARTAYNLEVAEAKGSAEKIKIAFDKLSATLAGYENEAKNKNPNANGFDAKFANDASAKQYTADNIELEKSLAAKEISLKEYEIRKRQLEDNSLQAHYENLNLEKDGTKAAMDEELAFRRKKNEEQIDAEREKWRKIAEFAQQGAEIIGAIGNGLFENSIANLDNEIAAVQRQKDNDIAIAGNNAKAKKKIEDDAARQTAALNRKKAMQERTQALFTIALQTAIGVTKAVAESPETFGLPGSAFALANGLIQAALVLSKPIPAYAKGIESAPKGVALVGEAGAELLQFGGKEKLVTQPTLVDLPGGTRVLNATNTLRIMEERGLSADLANGYAKSENIIASAQRTLTPGDIARIVGREVATKFDRLADAFANKPSMSMSMDRNGFNSWLENRDKRTQQMDSRYKRNG